MARTPRVMEPPYHPLACQPLLGNTQMGLKSGNKFILAVSTVARGPQEETHGDKPGKSPLEPLDKEVEGLAASTPSLALEFPEKEERVQGEVRHLELWAC